MNHIIIKENNKLHNKFKILEEDLQIHYLGLVKLPRKDIGELNKIEEAEERAREEGRLAERMEMAKELLKSGMEIDLVSKYTKLSAEEIKKL